MSSLRISHQNRTIGATTAGGDTGRSEHADDRSSFAVALGVAGAAPKAATTLLGGQTGEASPSPAHLRKRADTPGKLDDVASLAAQAALVLPANADAPFKPEDRQGKPADLMVAGGQDVFAANAPGAIATTAIAAVAGAASNAAGGGEGAVSGDSVNPLATTGAAIAAAASGSINPLPAAGAVATGISVGLINPLAAAAAATAGLTGGSVDPLAGPGAVVQVQPGISILRGVAPVASGAVSQVEWNVPDRRAPAPVTLGAGQPSVGQAQVAPTAAGDPATAVAPVAPGAVASATAIAASAPTPGSVFTPIAQTAGSTVIVAPTGIATDATGAASPLASTAAPSPGASQILPSSLAGLSPSLASLVAGQTSTGDAGGGSFGARFGAQVRDRFVPVAAPTDAASTGAAAALDGSGGTAALAAAPTVAPGSVADAAAGGAVSDQVAGHLVRLVSSGSSDMVMRLHPPELGDLTIRVAVSGHDVSAWFTSPQPEVQNAISAAMGQLQTDLGNAGYNLNGAWVGADASGAQQQGAPAPTPLLPRTPGTAPPLALPAAVPSRPAASGLNIYV